MDVKDFLQQIQRQADYRDQIVHVHRLGARPARFGTVQKALPSPLQRILTSEGIERLYLHQAQALEQSRQGNDILVVTGTASGKTLCYNLPVTEHLIENPDARAMYLFPTKALAQDQLGGLNRWSRFDPVLKRSLRAGTYDGDTPGSARSRIRRWANVLLTNPDMLHQGILPYHAKWADFFRNLRFVVIDELHVYRGIFGSQFANVLRRLNRLVEFHGGDCQFICCSATIGNPDQLARTLTGRPMELIDQDGSPRGEKHFVFWNPPHVDPSRLVRKSANIEAKKLFTELIRHGSQTIAFARARVAAELLYKYAKEEFKTCREEELADRIRAYRGGYLASDRREIEKLLFSGELKGVCATNALELGIDVGSLDAALLVGYPGTVSSAWQQAGRAGRRAEQSLAVLIAQNGPIDQYIIHHPDYFFSRTAERVVIDPDNVHILANHLSCAAFELPLDPSDRRHFGPYYDEILRTVCEDNEDLHKIADRYHWSSSHFPAAKVQLRTIGESTFAIMDTLAGEPRTLGNLDSASAVEQLYTGAIYLHEGNSYLVTNLDLAENAAFVRQTDVDYYTHPIVSGNSRVLAEEEFEEFSFGRLGFGALEVSRQTVGFKKIKFHTQETISQESLDLPPQTLRTRGLWFVPDRSVFEAMSGAGHVPAGGLAGLRNLSAWSLPILSMCDPNDIAGQINFSSFGGPALILYDRYLGGLGFARRGFDHFMQLLQIARDLMMECPCETGCPSCVGLTSCGLVNLPEASTFGSSVPDKPATSFLLELMQRQR